MKTRLTRHVDVEIDGAVFLVVGFGNDRNRLALLLRFNCNVLETLFVVRSFYGGVRHFGVVPALNHHGTVEGVDRDARRSAHCKRARFFRLKSFARVFVRSSDACDIHSLDTLLAREISLGPLHLLLRIAHRGINLALRFALCLARDASSIDTGSRLHRDVSRVHVHVNVYITVAVSRITSKRCGRAKRQSVLCVSNPDAAVHIAELDVWTASTNLTVHAVAYVLAIFDFQTEVAGDAAVDRARANRSVRIRWNDQSHAAVD